MENFPENRRRSDNLRAPNYLMESIRVHEVYPGIPNMRIPNLVLSFADPRAPGVSAYRDSFVLGATRTDMPEPAGPTQRAQPGRRGGPQNMFRGSRGSRGRSGRGTVLRVSVAGEHTARIVGAFESAHQRSDEVDPSHSSRTPTPPCRTPSPPSFTPSPPPFTPSPIRQSPHTDEAAEGAT